LDGPRHSRVVPHKLDRQVVEVVYGIGLLLPAVAIQVLAKIPALVEQANAGQRQSEVAGRLQMVPGQDSEAARVVGDALRQPELRRKIRNAQVLGLRMSCGEPAGAREVLLEIFGGPVHLREEGFIRRKFDQAALVDAAQQQARIVPCTLPQIRIQRAE